MAQHDGGGTKGLRVDDPWSVSLAADLWQEPVAELTTGSVPAGRSRGLEERERTAVYLEMQADETFQDVRRRYRRFAFPMVGAAFAWYLLYMLAATAAPRLMAQPVVGAVNVAMTVALAQFLTTFLLAWAYARHARLRRDPAALDLSWAVATRGGIGKPSSAATPEARR